MVAALCLLGFVVLPLAGCGGPRPVPGNGSGVEVGGQTSSPPLSPSTSPTPTPTPEAEPPVPGFDGPVWFQDVTAGSGVDFQHASGDSPEKPFPSANGSGLGAIDYDLDGRIDLYFATGTPFPIGGSQSLPLEGADRSPLPAPHNRCFRNLGGWRFQDVTGPSGLFHDGYSHGVAVGDFDADGFPDAYVTCYGGNVLFQNRGDGTFARVEEQALVSDGRWSSSAVWFDYDDDGLLDLYVCHYGKWSLEKNPFCGDQQRGTRVFCSPLTVEPEPDVLWHNQGDGSFREATAESGLASRPGRGLGVVAAHLDDTSGIDLYVANDLNANALFVSDGKGRFRDQSELSGTAYDHEGHVKSSMGVDAADTANRGLFDLMVTDFQGESNLFFANSGDGMFREASNASGAGPPSLPFVSWGILFADFDLDGWEDAIVSNGHVGDDRQKTGDSTLLQQVPLLLHNQRGAFVVPPREQLGAYFLARHQGRGVTSADLDNDGDLDLAFNHRDEAATMLRNDRGHPQLAAQSIVLHLVGTRSNRDAVGSVVTLQAGDLIQTRQIKGGGGYQSARDQRVLLAIPNAATLPVDTAPLVEIRWPNGRATPLAGIGAGQWLVIEPDSPEALPRVIALESLP